MVPFFTRTFYLSNITRQIPQTPLRFFAGGRAVIQGDIIMKKWSKLDNAAKIFPSTIEQSETRVFRFYCQLTEDVDPEALQQAVDQAILQFPQFLNCLLYTSVRRIYYKTSQCLRYFLLSFNISSKISIISVISR